MNFCLSLWRFKKDFFSWLEGGSISLLQLRVSFHCWLSSQESGEEAAKFGFFSFSQGVRRKQKKKTNVGLKEENG